MKPSELLSQPGAWCQGHEAIDKTGNPCEVYSSEAVAFCAAGAMWKCYGFANPEALVACMRLKQAVGVMPVVWNDAPERTQEEVVAKLKELGL